MPNLPKRTLGRTGLEVTTLGYGAMELRARQRPRRHDRRRRACSTPCSTPASTSSTPRSTTASPRSTSASTSPTGAPSTTSPRSAAACPAAPQAAEHVHTAENIREGVEQSLRRMKTDYLDLVQFHRSLTPDEFEADGALQEAAEAARRGQGALHRRVRHPAQPRRADRHGRLRRLPDPLLAPCSATTRTSSRRRPRPAPASSSAAASPAARPRTGDGRRYYMVDAKTLQSRWDEARLDELLDGMSRIELTLRFTLSRPGPRHDDRRHEEPRPPARQRRDRRCKGAAARRRRRRSQAPPRRSRLHATASRLAPGYPTPVAVALRSAQRRPAPTKTPRPRSDAASLC